MVKILFCKPWDWDCASAAERAALAEGVAAGVELVRWEDSVQRPCTARGRGCRVGPRPQVAMAAGDLEVYCFFDAAAVVAGAQGGAGAVGWTDLGNSQA